MKAKIIGLLVTLSIVAPLLAGASARTAKRVGERHILSGWQPQGRRPWGWFDPGSRHVLANTASHPQAALEAATRSHTPSEKPARGQVRFAPVYVYVDSGDKPLAAYQFELRARTGQIKIVGVEGGEHPAFREAPYYDPAALMNDRIIIAAFNTGSDLPHGRTRIATIHLQILGDAEPQYELKLMAVADDNSQEIPAELNLKAGETQ